MPLDLEILNRCRYAIFDLTDLGAQLVEMQEAKQKKIRSLLVYPVRERRNEPERGRRTVLSFDLPHFGYTNFAELRGCVWRFLTDGPAGRDVYPRTRFDPILDNDSRLENRAATVARGSESEVNRWKNSSGLGLSVVAKRRPERGA